MTTLNSNILLYASFQDFDKFSQQVRDWDLDFRQLDCGKFSAELLQLRSETVQMSYAWFNRVLDQRGHSPAGLWTFAFPNSASIPLIWRDRGVGKNTILVYRPGDEIDCASRAGFSVTTVSFTRETLDGMCQSLELPNIKTLLNDKDMVCCEQADMAGIIKQTHELYCFLKANPSQANSVALNNELKIEISQRLLFALASRNSVAITNRVADRGGVLSKALEYIEYFEYEPIKIMDLCQNLSVSERTLQYVFQKRYGVSPKTYINALRLNHVRKELLNAAKKVESIGHVANRWGFWHMGQFAADYRRMFGELPSETNTVRGPP